MITLFLNFLSLFTEQASSKNEPVRLEKKQDSIQLDPICRRICPYVILACVIILCVLLFVALVRYGHVFSTEANNWYYHME